ncbi:DNA circularization protein [Paraburkholderia susongensis]|uniref:Mu-like prophage DNA circulation protein n=1 Tax=Paraburkholderia susongensis TaxID=1515439 RepID=A0A1X7I4F9_9BURK|nr:DNA circularization N-terminal domain-containing protein [Paraburkholderia susongensis]SMG09407.1 Mu-like prophage DNA circulation protein [Paraburkholderia susongensis]
MSWEDELLPASFRGVPFEVEQDELAAGRRNQLHEYVQRDEPYVEDLGRATRGIRVTGFLNGDDCYEQARALIAAFEEEGPGELVHPWLGRMMVSTDNQLPTLRRTREEGRTIRFDAAFVEAGELVFPGTSTDTSMGLLSAGDSLAGVSQSNFGNWLAGINLMNVSSASWLTTGTRFMSVFSNPSIASTTSPFAAILAQFTGVPQFASTFLSSPLLFASTLLGLPAQTLYRYTGTTNVLTATGSTTRAIASVADVQDAPGADAREFQRASVALAQDALVVHTSRELATIGVNADAGTISRPSSDPTSVASIDRQITADRVELDEAGEAIVRLEPPVVDDVIEVRDELDDAIWKMAQTATHTRYLALMDTRDALLRHLTAVARSGVRLVAMTPTQPLPALVLAYRRYGDAGRADEILRRNRIAHPGFVPPRRLLVAER